MAVLETSLWMHIVSGFAAWSYKTAALIIGFLIVRLGYRLLADGVSGKFTFSSTLKGFKADLVSVSPGLLFVLLGVGMLVVAIRTPAEFGSKIESTPEVGNESEYPTPPVSSEEPRLPPVQAAIGSRQSIEASATLIVRSGSSFRTVEIDSGTVFRLDGDELQSLIPTPDTSILVSPVGMNPLPTAVAELIASRKTLVMELDGDLNVPFDPENAETFQQLPQSHDAWQNIMQSLRDRNGDNAYVIGPDALREADALPWSETPTRR